MEKRVFVTGAVILTLVFSFFLFITTMNCFRTGGNPGYCTIVKPLLWPFATLWLWMRVPSWGSISTGMLFLFYAVIYSLILSIIILKLSEFIIKKIENKKVNQIKP